MSEEVTETTEEVVANTAETTSEATEKAFVDTFLDSVTDEEIKSSKMWDNLKGKDADEFAKYVRELKSFTGKKGDIPKADATPEEWAEFHQKLGRPEELDGYDFGLSDDFKALVGEGQAGFHESALEAFKKTAFEKGLSTDAAEDLFNEHLSVVAKQTEEMKKVQEALEKDADNVLKNAWGDERDGIETGIKAMLKDKGGMSEEDVSELVELGLLKDPKVAIALGKINAKFADDPELGDMVANTKAGIEDQMVELQATMLEEKSKHGKILPHTKDKWMALNAKL